MDKRDALHGLYAITDPQLCPDETLPAQVELALDGGCRLIQFRDKRPDRAMRQWLAERLLESCRRRQALLIINDDIQLARDIGADGVHLGKHDTDPAEARSQLGNAAIIGVSCYNRLDLAMNAAARGADYLAFGRFFPSRSKPHAVQAEPHLLAQARAAIGLPLVAIGGITPENGAPLITAGADMLAVIHGVFGQPDVRAASQRLCELFAAP
ncbi:MAG: thiamine phosphate synthase [Chromatiales bacterium]|jgi:thiamine-phosphate pyrophosphorylase